MYKIKVVLSGDEVDLIRPLCDQFAQQSKYINPTWGVFSCTCRGLAHSPDGLLLFCVRGDEVVGTLGAIAFPDHVDGAKVASEVFWYVDRKHRGAGLRLIRFFEKWARVTGCKRVMMISMVDVMHERVGRLYKHIGYEPMEVHYLIYLVL